MIRRFFILSAICLATLALAGARADAQATAADVDARRAQLQTDLNTLEAEIADQRKILDAKQRESVSLERDIAILDAQIAEATLSIKARNLNIQQLTSDIGTKEVVIGNLSDKLSREKQSLAQILRKRAELDSFSLAEAVLSNENLSEFFSDLDSFDAVQGALRASFTEITQTKSETETEKKTLEEKKTEEVELRTIQELQRRRIQEKKVERNKILAATKGQEKAYQKILQAKEQSAAAIRAELFTLRDTAAIPFGKAVEYASRAGAKTGVRAALVLGVITQESNLGENTGQCLLSSLTTGAGIGKNTGRFFATVMKAPRDTEPFQALAQKIGFDPLTTAVSCPPSYGYGGAMGPAQFIPSTWVLYEQKIADLTGHAIPNPWDPEDAFMATAILMKENGAAAGTFTAERLAALRYFAGWKNAAKPAYAFYGDDVMELTTKYQGLIDVLQK